MATLLRSRTACWWRTWSAMSCVTSDVIPVFGYVSSAARVSCPYPAGYEDYEKYLCKNDCNDDDDVLVKSKGNSNKYSIYDDQKALTFTVTISHLRFDDAGKYWCGVTRTGNDIYTEVKLEVANATTCLTVSQTKAKVFLRQNSNKNGSPLSVGNLYRRCQVS
uniref:Immunoglobulin V-set domain-containing protein n=1 Tax=Poecilia mexicana TaxID=48701 RepID=A0A3B3X2G9_9TELE